MRSFLSLLILLSAPGSYSSDVFGPLNKIERALPPTVLAGIKATRRFRSSFGGANARCSGTFVSRDGYFLTSLHCIDFEESPHLSIQYHRFGGGVLRSVKLGPRGPSLRNQILLDDSAHRDLYIDSPQVIAVGTGNQIFPINRVDLLSKKNLEIANQVIRDFALLKFSGQSDYPCVPINSETIPNENLFAAGFPLGSETLAGDEIFLSLGKRVSEYTSNFPAAVWEVNQPVRYQLVPIRYSDLYTKDRYGFGKFKTMGGMSGGPIFNEKGFLIGILESRVGEFANFTSARFIEDTIKERFGSSQTLKIFSCDRD